MNLVWDLTLDCAIHHQLIFPCQRLESTQGNSSLCQWLESIAYLYDTMGIHWYNLWDILHRREEVLSDPGIRCSEA